MPDKIVIDASVVLKWFPGKNEKQEDLALKVIEKIYRKNISAYSSSFLLVETANILLHKRKVSNKLISYAIRQLLSCGIDFVDLSKEAVEDVKQIMFEYETTAYDAIYLSIAKKEKAKLLTFDDELLKIKNLTIGIEELVRKDKN